MRVKDRSKLVEAVDCLFDDTLGEASPYLTRAATAPAPDTPGKRGTPTKINPKVKDKQKVRREKKGRSSQDKDTQDRYKTTSPQQYRTGGFTGNIESFEQAVDSLLSEASPKQKGTPVSNKGKV